MDLVNKILKPEAAMMPLYVVLASLLTLATAHGFEHIGGLRPCALCLEQRGAYWLAVGFGAAGALTWRQPALAATPAPRVLVVGMILALLYGTYLAGFHTGVEQGWWEGPPSCTSTGGRSLAEMLQDGPNDIVMCDEIPWALFGISMAGYNFLIAATLTSWAAINLTKEIKS